VLHLRLIILSVRGNVPVDSETLLVTDFVNLKIKSVQFFGGAYRGRVYVRMFIGMSTHICISICVCTMFFKKIFLHFIVCFFLLSTRSELLTVFVSSCDLVRVVCPCARRRVGPSARV
jgi:hypothetical protein